MNTQENREKLRMHNDYQSAYRELKQQFNFKSLTDEDIGGLARRLISYEHEMDKPNVRLLAEKVIKHLNTEQLTKLQDSMSMTHLVDWCYG